MSRRQRATEARVPLDLNALAASCNTAYGADAMAWGAGEPALLFSRTLSVLQQEARDAWKCNKPAEFAEVLGDVVFEALALAGALGVDIALEVERARKLQAKVGK